MVLPVSGFQSQACHREVCWVLFYSAYRHAFSVNSVQRIDMFKLVKNRLNAYADDSTLLAVVASQQTDLLLHPPMKGS